MPTSRAPLGTLVPGTPSPVRTVPASVERPEYVGKDRELPFTGSEVKSAEAIERIRTASRIAAAWAIIKVVTGRETPDDDPNERKRRQKVRKQAKRRAKAVAAQA